MIYTHFYLDMEGIVNVGGNIQSFHTKENHNTCYRSTPYYAMLQHFALNFLPSNEDLIPDNLILLEAWLNPGLSPIWLV